MCDAWCVFDIFYCFRSHKRWRRYGSLCFVRCFVCRRTQQPVKSVRSFTMVEIRSKFPSLPLVVTSAKDVYVIPGVCLSVCFSVSNFTLKTKQRVFTQILPQMYLCTRKNWQNFGSHPPPDPDPGIFWRILQHCEIGHFSTVLRPDTTISLSLGS